MKKNICSSLELGATMYVPATHSPEKIYSMLTSSVVDAGSNLSVSLKSLVICLEDAVHESDVAQALSNLKLLLRKLTFCGILNTAVFIRPRNIEMAKLIVGWNLSQSFVGFVLPKFTVENCRSWAEVIHGDIKIMPTLETAEFFDQGYLREFRSALSSEFSEVLCLRVGGNDLLSCLSLRRPQHVTIYETPVSPVIKNIVGAFVPFGYQVSSPVFEHFSNVETLVAELELDKMNGLYTKTAIHPSQIGIIQNAYKVSAQDYSDATKVLDVNAKSVFKNNGSMLEVATHKNWAENVLLRAKTFGVIGEPDMLAVLSA